jgi:hypothetical protein
LPSNDIEDTLKFKLKPYIEDFFEIDPDPIVRKITQDTLEWIVWKVKQKNNGDMGDIQIEEIGFYNTSAWGNAGNLTIKIDGVEENVHAKASMLDESRCKEIILTLIYDDKRYKFLLTPEGKYSLIMDGTTAYLTDNARANKIFALRDVSLKIIPYIYQKYEEDKITWDIEKPMIIKEIQERVKTYYST